MILIASLFAIVAPNLGPGMVALPAGSSSDELTERFEAAGRDPGQLWELGLWCLANEREDDAHRAFERLLEVDPDHGGAHERLAHHRYDERWFTTYRDLHAYRRAEERRMLAERGLVRYGERWVAQADVPFVRMGWEQTEEGTWVGPHRLEQERRAAELGAQGWQQQDLQWISPDDFDPWRAGLWRCGEEWLDAAAADRYHAEVGTWWEVPGENFVVLSTCAREDVRWIVWWADQAQADLVRAVGVVPSSKPELVVLRDIEQYNAFAAGDREAQRPPTEGAGYSSVHYAFLADRWLDGDPLRYRGCGVTYWDRGKASLDPYGQHAVRHAAAHSYLEAIDPSWDVVSQLVDGTLPRNADHDDAFWGEKRLPRWFRYGLASYAGRYFRDQNVGEDGDPWWARKWAKANLAEGGGLPPLDEVFALELDPADPALSAQRISAAGLLVSFILDGDCDPVREAHGELKRSFQQGDGTPPAARALEQALRDEESRLRRYAGQ